jgi:hypothetical protein
MLAVMKPYTTWALLVLTALALAATAHADLSEHDKKSALVECSDAALNDHNPQACAKGPFDPEVFFKSIADIEQLTGEKFLTGIPNAAQLRQKTATKLWPLAKSDFDSGCDQQKVDVP